MYLLNRRAEWIRQLYPQVEVIEAPDGPTEVGDSSEIKSRHEGLCARSAWWFAHYTFLFQRVLRQAYEHGAEWRLIAA